MNILIAQSIYTDQARENKLINDGLQVEMSVAAWKLGIGTVPIGQLSIALRINQKMPNISYHGSQ